MSRYKNGASVPTGKIDFNFKAGDLDFDSSSYEWLVIANAKAMYRGVGTINGNGPYNFQLSVIDADVNPIDVHETDKFRTRIWDYTDITADLSRM